MNSSFKTGQKGAMILEALIAFLILAVGVGALLYLQGNLMSGSTLTKARAEAMELAKDRMELWRNYIEENQYLAAPSKPMENIVGINATYKVEYAPTTLPADVDVATKLTVTVSWPGTDVNTDGTAVEKQVILESNFYYIDPSLIVAIAERSGSGGENAFPLISPWITGKEGVDLSTARIGDVTPDDDLHDELLDPPQITNIKRYIAPAGDPGTGQRSNVEVWADKNGDGDSEVVLTSFGGIIHRIEGDIIIDPSARSTMDPEVAQSLIMLASPPSYCVFPICNDRDGTDGSGGVDADCIVDDYEIGHYVCYVPGDCTYQDEHVVAGGELEDCPANFIPPEDDGFEDLNGGWYGKVGNLSVHLDPDDKVCTTDTVIAGGSNMHLTPSRLYTANRCSTTDDVEKCLLKPIPESENQGINITGLEGINRSYNNQTFLINFKNGDDCDELALAYDFLYLHDIENPSSNISLDLVDEHLQRVLHGIRDDDGNPIRDHETVSWEENVVFPLNECLGAGPCTP